MKIFDLHADIGADIYLKHNKNNKNVFKNDHLSKLINGEVYGVTTACFFSGNEDWETMQAMVLATANELRENSETTRWILSKEDFIIDDKILAVISVEGMCGIIENPQDKIDWLYDNGVRVGSLTWNDSNRLAEGWPNDPLRGLSAMGEEVIKRMNQRKMIIDISHTNEKTFWDIISLSQSPIIATHSNARSLCNHQRNLTDQQIKAIGLKGGLVGLNAARGFINKDVEKQNAHHLAIHGKYIADLIGYEHLAIGFDFMDFFPERYNGSMANDLNSALESQNLLVALKEIGFSDYEIKAIAYDNVYKFLKRYL